MAKLRLILPEVDAVATTVGSLVDKAATCEPGRFTVGRKDALFVAIYVDDHNLVRYLGLFDIRTAAYTASALMLMPKNRADEAIEQGELDEVLSECFHEVANVCAVLFNLPRAPHVRLDKVYSRPPKIPGAVLVKVRDARARRQCEIDIAGYGKGKLAWLVI
jgi:hypothetical protein